MAFRTMVEVAFPSGGIRSTVPVPSLLGQGLKQQHFQCSPGMPIRIHRVNNNIPWPNGADTVADLGGGLRCGR